MLFQTYSPFRALESPRMEPSTPSQWEAARAPESLHFLTMSVKYCCSVARRLSNFSTVSMSTCGGVAAAPVRLRRQDNKVRETKQYTYSVLKSPDTRLSVEDSPAQDWGAVRCGTQSRRPLRLNPWSFKGMW